MVRSVSGDWLMSKAAIEPYNTGDRYLQAALNRGSTGLLRTHTAIRDTCAKGAVRAAPLRERIEHHLYDPTKEKLRNAAGTAADALHPTTEKLRNAAGTAADALHPTTEKLRSAAGTAVDALHPTKEKLRSAAGSAADALHRLGSPRALEYSRETLRLLKRT
eukprot:3025315-Prymnesium_polylepis.1